MFFLLLIIYTFNYTSKVVHLYNYSHITVISFAVLFTEVLNSFSKV